MNFFRRSFFIYFLFFIFYFLFFIFYFLFFIFLFLVLPVFCFCILYLKELHMFIL